MIEDWDIPDLDERTIKLFQKLDAKFGQGPEPIPGDYTTTHGREQGWRGLAFYAIGFTSSRALTAYAMREVLLIPARNTTVVARNSGTIHEHYQVMGTDEFHYPFKGIVDWVRNF
jgi:hypothetical protein